MNLCVSADMLRNTGGSVNPAAYENYLKALGYMQRYDKSGNLDLAVVALKNSVLTDPPNLDSRLQPGKMTIVDNELLGTIATEAAALVENASLAQIEICYKFCD